MLETLVTIGAPSFFPKPVIGSNLGNGGFCSINATGKVLKGQHAFLPFVPNGINWVAMDGQDVISGPFSGCIMATYTENGIRKVCHVSTGDFGDCLGAWNTAKRNFSDVREFKPSDFIGNTAHDYCYGLITATLEPYTILTQPKKVALSSGGHALTDHQFVKKTKGSFR